MSNQIIETGAFLGGRLAPKVLKIGGWLWIIMGVPFTLFFGIGFFFILVGVVMLWFSKKMKQQFTPEQIEANIAQVGSVIATVKKSVETAEKQ